MVGWSTGIRVCRGATSFPFALAIALQFLLPSIGPGAVRLRDGRMNNRLNRNRLEIQGEMSTRGADRAGNKLANAAAFLAVAIGLAALIYAIRWW